MNNEPIRREPFFLYFAWFLLLMVIVCFGGKAVFDTDDLPPLTYLHHLHAVAMLSWFVLFAVQPTLIQLGKTGLHRLLGKLSPLVVIVFMTFSLMISRLNWERVGEPLIVTANGVNVILFTGFYVAAIAWRRHAAAHKRLMVYATIMLMGPAAGRLPEIFDASPFLAAPLVLALQLAPLVHDLVVRRRAHPATWAGSALSILTIPIIIGLSGSPAWAAMLENILGAAGPRP